MKIKLNFLKIFCFCFVLAVFAIPPLFIKNMPESAFSSWTFPLNQLSLFLFSLLLIYFNQDLGKFCPPFSEKKYFVFYRIIFPCTFVFCLLFCFSLFAKALSVFFSFRKEVSNFTVSFPETFIQWIFCILSFVFSAFYEETVYRFFLPQVLIYITKNNGCNFLKKYAVPFLIEFSVCLLFAFAHAYSGIPAVLNAAAAHAVLRLCYIKCGNIFAGWLAHFLYNLLQLVLLCSGAI